MNLEDSDGLVSNDQQSARFEVKAGCHTTNSHISQIPGLSPTISSLPEEKTRGRRAGILETDSDYVKLAKQGGHKGLLWHMDSVVPKPSSYQPPDWFGSESGIISGPSEEKKGPGVFQPLEPPFGIDNISAWDRDNSSKNERDKDDISVHHRQAEKLQASSQYYETTKYRRIVHDKNPSPVDMSKLLSFGYAEDNKPRQ